MPDPPAYDQSDATPDAGRDQGGAPPGTPRWVKVSAIAVFLALAVVGLTSDDAQLVRAVYLAAEPITWFVIVPLALASLVTGIVQSLASTWGLFRHYWILFKLLISVIATVVLLLYTETVGFFAGLAANSSADLTELRAPTFVLHSGAALVLLLAATVLAVYKPRGMTRYGHRKQAEQRRQREAAPAPTA